MNYQNGFDCKEVFEAEKILDVPKECLAYYAFPLIFSSTTGPFEGYGGQAICVFSINSYTDGRKSVLFCRGKYWKTVDFGKMMDMIFSGAIV